MRFSRQTSPKICVTILLASVRRLGLATKTQKSFREKMRGYKAKVDPTAVRGKTRESSHSKTTNTAWIWSILLVASCTVIFFNSFNSQTSPDSVSVPADILSQLELLSRQRRNSEQLVRQASASATASMFGLCKSKQHAIATIKQEICYGTWDKRIGPILELSCEIVEEDEKTVHFWILAQTNVDFVETGNIHLEKSFKLRKDLNRIVSETIKKNGWRFTL